jgi:hypothetical protein
LAIASILSACSSHTTAGTPSTAPADPSPTTSAQLAPKVPAALPTDTILSDPCQGISSTQADTIGLVPQGIPKTLPYDGKGCNWKSATDTSNEVAIAPLAVSKNGMNDIYANNALHKFQLFQPLTIAGYPAAKVELAGDQSTGNCTLWVGVTDQLAVQVEALISFGINKTNPCPIATKVAEAMIEHLKGAA